HLCGRIESLKLVGYKRELGSDDLYEMVTKTDGSVLPLAVYTGGLNDDFVEYKLAGASEGIKNINNMFLLPEAKQELSLSFVGTLANGNEIRKIFTFRGDSYLFDVVVKLASPSADGSRLWIEWPEFAGGVHNENRYDFHGYMYLQNNKVNKTALTEVKPAISELGPSDWVAYSDKYFMAALVPAEEPADARIVSADNIFSERLSGGASEGSFRLYVGPKEYPTLTKIGYQLHRSIDLGIFSFLAHPLLQLIRWFYLLLGNYGLAIVLLTLLIKALFLPLTKKSFESMAKMQDLKPDMDAIRARYKDDATRMNQEIMALYKKKGVNPASGCFPMLIQIPVFLGLYNALLNSIELRHAHFALWIHDLSAPERLMLFGLPIPVMVLIMGASMFVQQWTTPSAMDPTQKKIMMFMPVMFTFFFVNFPAGLVLYWLVNNLISIVQQYFIRKERAAGAKRATAFASVAIFGLAYILTLL
ncbi:MAG: membrane protein insertase YidC, partial [Bdellovibrionales bacterium]|nr:membrane protein insertase YidC [Bdellovibrionales bacterium]